MTNDCPHLVALLLLLLITHWTNAASLNLPLSSPEHALNLSVMNAADEQSDSDDSQLPLFRRLRRWSTNGGDDEVEVPLNEPANSTSSSDPLPSEAPESSPLPTEMPKVVTTTAEAVVVDENTTIQYPILRQDLLEVNQTEEQTMPALLADVVTISNQTDSSLISTARVVVTTDVPIKDDRNESTTVSEVQSTSHPVIFTQTTQESEAVTTEKPTYSTAVAVLENNRTELLINDVLTTAATNESAPDPGLSPKDAIVPIDSQTSIINETSNDLIETLQTSTSLLDTSTQSVTIPECDAACHCAKECLYGFELHNDTCLCHPPCENYPCFGNDTCVLTDEGHPFCQPENGTEHDRPTRCYQPRDAGYHDVEMRYHSRWYYHPDQDTCHLFVYRGLGGNENNFLTLQDCHLECITCAPSPDRGECFGHINMWYFDRKSNECREFGYSGCKGNDNKFMQKEQCVHTCVDRTRNAE